MKKITVLTAMLMLFGLTGCDHIAAKDNMPEPPSFSESNEISSDTETFPATEEREIETEPEIVQSKARLLLPEQNTEFSRAISLLTNITLMKTDSLPQRNIFAEITGR